MSLAYGLLPAALDALDGN